MHAKTDSAQDAKSTKMKERKKASEDLPSVICCANISASVYLSLITAAVCVYVCVCRLEGRDC